MVALRYNTGKGIGGRSKCFSCGKTLHAWELIPLFSYLLLKGKCSKCKSRVSLQYPLVELLVGTMFALVVYHYLPLLSTPLSFMTAVVLAWIATAALTVIFVYDMRHKIIPDGMVVIFSAVALLEFIRVHGVDGFTTGKGLLDLSAGLILALGFFILWAVSKGRWIGLGDAKLVIGIGWFLGLVKGISAVIVGFWSGAIFSIIIVVLQKKITFKSEIPFAPFLIIGFYLGLFFGWDVLHLNDFLLLI